MGRQVVHDNGARGRPGHQGRVHAVPGARLAARLGRDFILIDNNPQAARIMARRLAFAEPECVHFAPRDPPPRR